VLLEDSKRFSKFFHLRKFKHLNASGNCFHGRTFIITTNLVPGTLNLKMQKKWWWMCDQHWRPILRSA